MLVLLDEQIDVRMKQALSDFAVFTIQDMGWLGMKRRQESALSTESLYDWIYYYFARYPYASLDPSTAVYTIVDQASYGTASISH